MDNQRQETVSDPKELFSSGRKTSEYVKERTKNFAQITEYLNQELARNFFFEEEAGCD